MLMLLPVFAALVGWCARDLLCRRQHVGLLAKVRELTRRLDAASTDLRHAIDEQP